MVSFEHIMNFKTLEAWFELQFLIVRSLIKDRDQKEHRTGHLG